MTTIAQAMKDLENRAKKKKVELGLEKIGGQTDIIVFALNYFSRHIEQIMIDEQVIDTPTNDSVETCDVCQEDIPIGHGWETPCSVWCHNDECFDSHMADCLNFDCCN